MTNVWLPSSCRRSAPRQSQLLVTAARTLAGHLELVKLVVLVLDEPVGGRLEAETLGLAVEQALAAIAPEHELADVLGQVGPRGDKVLLERIVQRARLELRGSIFARHRRRRRTLAATRATLLAVA